ncbi:transcriptional activator protein acu-15 [Aspergillus sclerotialis]|uniref:Transcriptional activator protein acu-15 n=1 Tax=Aspergillus sclerotialis TaxID=2070753 RepID=A0A3A2ZB15_9EURO|nr:transcriptional activator protein acu-15 [Aspergillus sclerotialis]
MPGILPMKVIKVGNGSQSRVAQACDRCRSKKIRCDGVRPCCTQCANVGFECKTSDKLSRRAFPRGYTESLEERVRSLEAEVRDLKNLLNEKDEKIDVLSRIHSFSPPSQHKSVTTLRPAPAAEPVKPNTPDSTEGRINVQHPQPEQSSEDQTAGLSSTKGFVDVFKSKLAEGGLSTNVPTQALTQPPPTVSLARPNQPVKVPPRLVSDQLINIFFQEWAPLYPVVHRPTVLKAYEQFLSNLESFQGNAHDMAQLNLIFGIAGLASKVGIMIDFRVLDFADSEPQSRTNQDPTFFEENWSSLLETLSSNISVPTLQCLVLAQMYCMTKADYRSLLRYRSLGVSVCQQLGLHRSQKNASSNVLVVETRKKVFWCQYVLDRFAAAVTGLPVLLREEDISIEYPEDVDDENVTESGFLPTLPGESTRLSSALALFSASRILNKTLENLYPAGLGYEILVSKMRSVAGQLDEWSRSLPPHLRLEFSQDKPSTNVTSSRSPLLATDIPKSLIYYYIRSLIHRPAVCFGDEQIKSPSVLTLSDSSKHIIQILELLDERRLCLSFNLNRKELVFAAGLGLLWQNMGLKRDSKLVKESRKLLSSIVEQLESEHSPAATQFSGIANILVSLDGKPNTPAKPTMSPPSDKPMKFPKKQIQSWKQRLAGNAASEPRANPDCMSRRATISGASPPNPRHIQSPSRASLPSTYSEPVQNFPPDGLQHQYLTPSHLEYDHTHSTVESASRAMTATDWEYVLGDMDRGYSNIFTGIYGGKECGEDHGPFASLTAEYNQKPEPPMPVPVSTQDVPGLSPETWSASSSDIPPHQETNQSAFSYSEESMGSADDGAPAPFYDLPFQPEEHGGVIDPFRGMMMPAEDVGEFGLAGGWDRRLAV